MKKKNPFKHKEEHMEEVVVEDAAEEPTGAGLEQQLEELHNQYIRMAADFDNYRKRQVQERESLLKYGAERALKELLGVLDNFERAEKALEEVDDAAKCKEGLEVLHRQLFETLQKLGLKTIATEGVEFDPNMHEAIMQTPSDAPHHSILQELQKGYMLDDRVLRAALVNVAVNE